MKFENTLEYQVNVNNASRFPHENHSNNNADFFMGKGPPLLLTW